MKKRSLMLDKELVTSGEGQPAVDGGTTPLIVFSLVLAVTMLDPGCATAFTAGACAPQGDGVE